MTWLLLDCRLGDKKSLNHFSNLSCIQCQGDVVARLLSDNDKFASLQALCAGRAYFSGRTDRDLPCRGSMVGSLHV
jgi:hypothetical protein